MALTEVLFEFSDASDPVCRFTEGSPDARCILRVLDPGAGTGPRQASMTIIADAARAAALAKEIKGAGPDDDVHITTVAPGATTLTVGRAVEGTRALLGLEPVEKFLSAFGSDAFLDNITAQDGRIRARAVLAMAMDSRRAREKMQDVQRGVSWEHFRVLRVSEFKPGLEPALMGRVFTPEQENLLRLAHAMGYYDSPKRCTLEDIAKKVDLSVSPVHKKLKNVEQVLIDAHVDPTALAPPDTRRRARASLPPHEILPAFTELSVRARWDASPLLAFTTRNPGTRIVARSLHENEPQGAATALIVVLARADLGAALADEISRLPGVRDAHVASKDDGQVTLTVTSSFATAGDWRTHPHPHRFLASRIGAEHLLKPIIYEGGVAHLRYVLRADSPGDGLAERLAAARDADAFLEFALAGVRAPAGVPRAGLPPASEKMTARQEEILKIAHALGYYQTPRGCTLEVVARTLGISANAIHKNLIAAEEKIVTSYLTGLDQ